MTSIHRALRAAHTAVTKHAPTEVTVYRITYANDEDARDVSFQGTYSTHRVRGTFVPTTDHQPIQDEGTVMGTVTLNRVTLGFLPSVADRMAVGGVVFNVTEAKEVEGAVVVCKLRGPSPAPVEAADVVPPIITAGTASGASDSISYTATINESSVWRGRYRSPAFTGQWITERFSETPGTAAAGSFLDLQAGGYEVAVQARDVAGNLSDWFNLGTVLVGDAGA